MIARREITKKYARAYLRAGKKDKGQLANRLVGILHGCCKTGAVYDEDTAWQHHQITTRTIAA